MNEISIANRKSQIANPAGFTLVEMLVVISIIVLLAGFLLVAVNRVYKQGSRTRSSADLASIATALEAYKQDFGSYPQVNGVNSGATVLAKALIGPSPKPKIAGPYTQGQVFQQSYSPPQPPPPVYVALVDVTGNPPTSPQETSDWVQFSTFDSNDGSAPDWGAAGFRVGPRTLDDGSNGGTAGDGVPDRPGGKVWGPYVPPDKFITKPDAALLFDGTGNPILYFSANTAKPNIGTAPNYVNKGGRPLYDASENLRLFMRGGETNTDNAVRRIKAVLGDVDLDGAVNRQGGSGFTESAVDQPYLLWSAGADGVFGPGVSATPTPAELHDTVGADKGKAKHNADAVSKCDDVTNFR